MNLKVGVKAFLKNNEDKFLLLKRNMEKYKGAQGSWDIVGGRITPGTTLVENLQREITEETGLRLTSVPRIIAAQDILNPAWPDSHTVRITYVAEAEGTMNLDTTENTEYRWLTIDEMCAMNDLDVYVKELVNSHELKRNL
jgi:ADP-ribose pyrophosphatase YjhB (NUDIX family)